MSYKVRFLNDEEFDVLPGKNMEDKLGIAYPNSQEAYVRDTGVPIIDVFNMAHELEHLEGNKLHEHYDADNQCYYKSKSNFFSKVGSAITGVAKTIAPVALPVLAAVAAPALLPAIGGALGGVGSAVSGALGAISPALGGAAESIGGALGNVGAGIGGLFGGGQHQAMTPFAGSEDPSLTIDPYASVKGSAVGSATYYPNSPQLSQQQLQNSPYQQGAPGFQTNPYGSYGSYPGQSTQGMAFNPMQQFQQAQQMMSLGAVPGYGSPSMGGARIAGYPGVSQVQGAMGQPGGFWQNMMPPGGNLPRTGINTGDKMPESGDFLSGLGLDKIFSNIPAAAAGAGVLGLGELMNKPINMPNFMDQPHVKALTEWGNTANHPMDPNVRDAIQRTLDIQNEQQTRNLRDVYKNLRPGTDYTTDSNYTRDLERLNRNMAMQGADAMAGAQFRSNEQNIGNYGNLAQLGVGQNLGQAAIDAQRQASRNRLFGNVGSMLGYKGIFGNQGPGLGAMSPFNLNQGGQP